MVANVLLPNNFPLSCCNNVIIVMNIIIIFKYNNYYFCCRDVVNLWRGSNRDHNANKTASDVVLALKQFRQIQHPPQNAASSRARYVKTIPYDY